MGVKSHIPLSFFSTLAFLGLNGEMARKVGISLDRNNIRMLIIKEAKEKKDKLKNILKKCFVFLKMDGCTRKRIHYFAIKGVTKALVFRNTQDQHTSEYLFNLVEKVLDKFERKK